MHSLYVLGRGKISFAEFVALMEFRMARGSQESEMQAMFSVFDKDNSGYVDAKELKTTMTELGMPLTDEEVKNMMGEIGVEEDGRIFYEGDPS